MSNFESSLTEYNPEMETFEEEQFEWGETEWGGEAEVGAERGRRNGLGGRAPGNHQRSRARSFFGRIDQKKSGEPSGSL